MLKIPQAAFYRIHYEEFEISILMALEVEQTRNSCYILSRLIYCRVLSSYPIIYKNTVFLYIYVTEL